MKISAHTFGILLRLAFLCAGAVFMTLRATGQNTETPPAQTAPRDDTATIEDDPTAVPDPKESADNNVTFPIDI